MAKTKATTLSSQAVPIKAVQVDHQMDTVIEIKGSTSTVTVSLDKKNEEGDQVMDSAAAVDPKEEALSESAGTEKGEEMQKCEDSQMDIVAGSTATVTVTLEKNEEGASDEVQKETNGGEQMKKKPRKRKRKAPSAVEDSPPKKTKVDDGYRLYVGNLNKSKTFDEVKDSLANYFTTQSLLVQDIRVDRSKKYAFVDLASEVDLNKGLTFHGEMMHDKPMKIAKAKAPPKDKAAPAPNDTLYLTNLPRHIKEVDLKNVFETAVSVTLPLCNGKARGFAFVKFAAVEDAEKALKSSENATILKGDVGINFSQIHPNAEKKEAAAPNNTLFVTNLPLHIKEVDLKKMFGTAVRVNVPQCKGKSKGFAFIKFAAVEDAENALKASLKKKMFKGTVGIQFGQIQADAPKRKFQSKRLIVMGLSKETTAETLKSAFEGSLETRIPVEKKTGVSKGFGFVDFESEDNCKAVKEAMQNREIDGCKVTVAYAEVCSLPIGRPAGQGPAKRKRKRAKKSGAGKPQEAVKEENKV
ncbi:nucleolin-like isoform X1 [Clinocottus analis]|uniref:nucleolin-like isoform X1 n=1 Tax=Clinocottus analis TaxID=304258 RepID=UPI0035C07CD5